MEVEVQLSLMEFIQLVKYAEEKKITIAEAIAFFLESRVLAECLDSKLGRIADSLEKLARKEVK
jgi:macrodomain Ter protein organizer (MatP/YcbG family)